MSLESVPTYILVKELEKREGVIKEIAEPDQQLSMNVDGPAIVLVVRD